MSKLQFEAAKERGVLPLMTAFHRLEFGIREQQGVSPEERQTEGLLRDLFEPRRVTPTGVQRTPIRMSVDRRAWMIRERATHQVRVDRLSLREVQVRMSPAEIPQSRRDLAISIEGLPGVGTFGFVGHVSFADRELGRLGVVLDAPLDPQLFGGGPWSARASTAEGALPVRAPSGRRVLVAMRNQAARDRLVAELRSRDVHVHVLPSEVNVMRWLGTALLTLDDEALRRVVLPDSIVTDVAIPAHCGMDLLAALKLRPWSTVVVMTNGFGDLALRRAAMVEGSAVPVDGRTSPNWPR